MTDGVAFTGTQDGMTGPQIRSLHRLLPPVFQKYGWKFHHGDCIGADEEAHRLCRKVFQSKLRIIIHPPSNPTKRAFCVSELRPEAPYIERNHDMVDETSALVATPKTTVEELRSGTWATIRYARLKNKSIFLVYPDGRVWFESISLSYEVDLIKFTN